MRRLSHQIYLGFVLIVVLFGVLAATAWFLTRDELHERRDLRDMARLIGDVLPAPGQPRARLEEALERLHRELGFDLAVTDPRGRLLAAAGRPLPLPPGPPQPGWTRLGHGEWGMRLRLPDGRWIVARHVRERGLRWLWALLLLGLAVGIGAHPLARRITRRLERLKAGVDELGAGDLGARVQVQGRDEVAELARSFNRAAERIERLVGAQRSMLAGASHELRSPLTRIRMALELLGEEGDRPALRERIAQDVAELDALIDELLLASRLEAGEGAERREPVELLALAAEEGARVRAEVSGTPVTVAGDPRWLRHMLRNLFENARRHGGGAPIEAAVARREDGGARVSVADAGPGIAEAERERIFEPFYRPAGLREGRDPGVGLGLALVRRIAERHGGAVRCLPREGGGTRFEIDLPAR